MWFDAQLDQKILDGIFCANHFQPSRYCIGLLRYCTYQENGVVIDDKPVTKSAILFYLDFGITYYNT